MVGPLALVLLVSCQAAPPANSIAPVLAPSAGQIRADSKGIEQVWVPAGSFLMGTELLWKTAATETAAVGLKPVGNG